MANIQEGDLLWRPSPEVIENANLTEFRLWLAENRGLDLPDYDAMWQWSVTEIGDFWQAVWDFTGVVSSAQATTAIADKSMPGTDWFPGAKLNYAENIFTKLPLGKPVMYYKTEDQPLVEISVEELTEKVAALRQALISMGVEKGDRVSAYLPNAPEAIISVLAVSSIGAIWSSCAPDFGPRSVLDRFKQIEPKVLITIDGYQYNGKQYSRTDTVEQLRAELPTLEHVIVIPAIGAEKLSDTHSWPEVIEANQGATLEFEQVPFKHPLWILYSSGTTGLPKPIVQGHGGCLMEHIKATTFHNNLGPDDIFFWFSSTGWMMWNYLLGSLLTGCSIFLYDGSPGYPSLEILWQLAEEVGVTYFGTSPAFVSACMNAKLKPNELYDLSKIKAVGSTGAPLTIDNFKWIYDNVNKDLALESQSGGTDLCTSIVGGARLKPVHAGEIQGASLGAKIQAFDPAGEPVIGEVGELVITEPMPSMPLFFWNDEGDARYKASYFEMYPNIWRHGDWIKFNERGGCIIYGRSDSTINRKGVRMGTSEIYRCVESIEEIVDSLVVDLESLGHESYMPLFIVLREGTELTDDLQKQIKSKLRSEVSPRHVPNDIFVIDEVPYTLSGKKLEIPVRRVLLGQDPDKVVNRGAMRNPQVMAYFIKLAQELPT